MPLEYLNGGVVAEHCAVREGVGVFDVSHLGTALLRGSGAISYLNEILTNDLNRISNGQAQYTLLLNDVAGVIDDLIVYRISDDEALLIPNAANSSQVLSVLRIGLPDQIEVIDWHQQMAVIAVQGPKAPQVLAALGLPFEMNYFSFIQVGCLKSTKGTCGPGLSTADASESMFIARTGYTGELGYEIVLPAVDATLLWAELMAAIAHHGGVPAGLGARDTLRTEMGYALHGHEISPTINPLQAGLSWAIGWHKPKFFGKASLEKLRASSAPAPRLAGLKANQRGVLRRGMKVFSLLGAEVGEITSGTFSPSLEVGVALALMAPEINFGDQVQVDVRGRFVGCEVARPPLVFKDPKGPVLSTATPT